MAPLDDAARLIRRANAIALATHVSPDPDAIGSLLGAGGALRTLGKRVAMLCDDPPPGSVDFLPGLKDVRSTLPRGFKSDLFIGLDASDPGRLGEVAQPLMNGAFPVLVIDHHVTNPNFGAVNVVEPETSSCAEVLLKLLDKLKIKPDRKIATCLMAGIVGDTRGFSTSNVTPATLRSAARLAEAGADLREISERVLSRHSLEGLRLLGLALGDVHFDNEIIWSAIPFEKRKAAGLADSHEAGVSNILLTVPEARVSAAFVEQADGRVDVSMRARPGSNVAKVALELGGGGHPAAAGCTIDGPLTVAVERVLGLLQKMSKRG